VPAFKFSVPALSLAGLLGAGGQPKRAAVSAEPLPPVLVVEGRPDPSLAEVIDAAAERLHAVICPVDDLGDLARDPDLDAVIGVVLTRPRAPRDWSHAIRDARDIVGFVPVAVLAPQPTSLTLEAALPLDPAFVAPPMTVDRLLYALGLGTTPR
jgi:hypothetical protein